MMCKPQLVQLDCRMVDCKFNRSGGTCIHLRPIIIVGFPKGESRRG